MQPQQYLSSIVILSASSDGQTVQCQDLNGHSLSEESSEIVMYIPVVLVEHRLVSRDYDLYIFNDEKDLAAKMEEIKKTDRDAMILIGTHKERQAYFIEDKELVSLVPQPISCGYDLDKINSLHVESNGKVDRNSNDYSVLNAIVRHIRLEGGRGNEAEITGTRTGKNVFSHSFGPCNAVVAKRKKDNLFVINHADNVAVDQDGGIGQFLRSVKEGEGAEFIAVMQNPKIKRNIVKAPLIAAGVAVELQDMSVRRINFPEGYNAIACINGNTVILTNKIQFFRDESEKNKLLAELRQESNKPMGHSREIAMEKGPDIITMPKTLEEVKVINREMKQTSKSKQGPYEMLIIGLQKLGIEVEPSKKEGLLKRIFKF